MPRRAEDGLNKALQIGVFVCDPQLTPQELVRIKLFLAQTCGPRKQPANEVASWLPSRLTTEYVKTVLARYAAPPRDLPNQAAAAALLQAILAAADPDAARSAMESLLGLEPAAGPSVVIGVPVSE